MGKKQQTTYRLIDEWLNCTVLKTKIDALNTLPWSNLLLRFVWWFPGRNLRSSSCTKCVHCTGRELSWISLRLIYTCKSVRSHDSVLVHSWRSRVRKDRAWRHGGLYSMSHLLWWHSMGSIHWCYHVTVYRGRLSWVSWEVRCSVWT